MDFAHLKAKVAVPLLALCLWNLWESCWGGAGFAMPGGQHRGSGDVLEATSPWMAGSGPAAHETDCHLELCLSKPKSERPQVTRRSWLLL